MRPAWGASPDPLLVFVPPLTPLQTKQYLVSLYPRCPSSLLDVYTPRLESTYSKYIDLLYMVCAEVTSDPKHLSYIASAHWPGFIAPVVQEWKALYCERQRVTENTEASFQSTPPPDERSTHTSPSDMDMDELAEKSGEELNVLYPVPTNDDFHRLSRRSNKGLVSALHTLYPRLMSAPHWAELNAPPKTLRLSDTLAFSQSISTSPSKQKKTEEDTALGNLTQRLTWRAKLMLVASYLASLNPSKTDARLFERSADGGRVRLKKGGGARKSPTKSKGAVAGAASKLPRHLTGPSVFPLDRFKAIFEALILEHGGDQADEEEWSSTEASRVQVLACMSELVQMQLIQRGSPSSEDKLEGSTTFKSNVTTELAHEIARELKIDLGGYLCDVFN
ncbi:origin recognition complex, subunit 5 [Cantharellus anzutake]|uniref:origin recognition complex, subunit 5 n=1 Tax=Cantharellus anzutake TaxID=1750568 RepID=UPI001908DC00|nr:origin recognition complex, subunit 5 [Cantharellus anzutake]KAF8324894.1 origin recognition complex, subunit 5 [Cantharellus anzutake]